MSTDGGAWPQREALSLRTTKKFVIVLIVLCASDLPQFTLIMTGTDSDNDITLNDLLKKTHSTVAKENAAAAPSAPSANAATAPYASSTKAIMDQDDDDVTLATLDALKKKSTKKDSDDLSDTDDKIPKKKWTEKKRFPVDSNNPGL